MRPERLVSVSWVYTVPRFLKFPRKIQRLLKPCILQLQSQGMTCLFLENIKDWFWLLATVFSVCSRSSVLKFLATSTKVSKFAFHPPDASSAVWYLVIIWCSLTEQWWQHWWLLSLVYVVTANPAICAHQHQPMWKSGYLCCQLCILQNLQILLVAKNQTKDMK